MAYDQDDYHSHVTRLNPQDLPSIQTSFVDRLPKNRQNGLRPAQSLGATRPRQQRSVTQPAPTTQPIMERRQSKMSLFGLFSKPKVEKLRGYTEGGLPEVPELPHLRSPRQNRGTATYNPPPNIIAQAPPKAISTLVGSPRATQPQPPAPPRESSHRALSHRQSRANLTRQPPSPSWETPLLSQALSQSVKNASLPALNYSAESILRAQKSKRLSLLSNFRDSKIDLNPEDAEAARSKVTERANRRLSSQSLTGSGWTRKIYVLLGGGLLLQYSGDGSSDRHPEKILQLSKDSAAFACDAIPGKHWVLQVSQATNSDGSGTPEKSRSFLGRLRAQNSTRKSAGNMLLVMENPEEMNSWMITIREEIEALGGKKSRPDDHLVLKADDSVENVQSWTAQQHPATSQRTMHTTMSPIQDAPSSPAIFASEWNESEKPSVTERKSSDTTRRSMVDGPQPRSPNYSLKQAPSNRASTSTTRLSSGEQQLNQLRDGSWGSNISSNTMNTSRASSPESQHTPPKKSIEQESRRSSVQSKYNYSTSTTNSWRRSMQTLPQNEYSVFPSESPPRGKRISQRSDSTVRLIDPPNATPPHRRQPSLGVHPETLVESMNQEPPQDVSPKDRPRSTRPVKSTPNLMKTYSISSNIEENPLPPLPAPTPTTTTQPSKILPLHSVSALNREPTPRTNEPRGPRRHSAVPMRLPIRPSLPVINTDTTGKPVPTAFQSSFLATPSPSTPAQSILWASGAGTQRSSSAPIAISDATPPPPPPPKPTPPSLQRPNTVQVRTNQAPFLSAMRPTSRTSVVADSPTIGASPSTQHPKYNPRSSSLFAPTSVSPTKTSGSAGAILAPPPRGVGGRYFSESSTRVPLQFGVGNRSVSGGAAPSASASASGVGSGNGNRRESSGLNTATGAAPRLAGRASMPFLNRDSGIGLPPPSAPPPEVPLPRVPTVV